MEVLNDINAAAWSLHSRNSSPWKSQQIDASMSEEVIEYMQVIKRKLLQKYMKPSRATLIRTSFEMNSEQIQTITSMLPDEVLMNPGNYDVRKFEAAVVSVDISGFTDLSDKYQQIENGASKLSMVLNYYMGMMVVSIFSTIWLLDFHSDALVFQSEIFSVGGDILKYAGDAFLAIFKVQSDQSMQIAMHKAIDSALIIQKNSRDFQTEVGVILNGANRWNLRLLWLNDNKNYF